MPVSPPNTPLELRFTRAHQARVFWLVGVGLLCLAAGLALLGTGWLTEWPEPVLASPWPALVPAGLAGAAVWFAARLTRHPFLVFSPIGIEVSPLVRPGSRARYVTWSEVSALGVSDDLRLLEIGLAAGGKILVSLEPVSPRQRHLLGRAVAGLVARRDRPADGNA